MKCYGIPDNIIKIIRNLYSDSRCAVRANGQIGEWFKIVTGVRQGCILSPLLFLLVMDWILKRAADNSNRGIHWICNESRKLTDLDFADDIALLDDSWEGMKDLTSRVEKEAGSVGLRINSGKTKLMVVGNMGTPQIIMVDGKQVEEVDEFCYLGSVISGDTSCDKDIRTRLGKANATFTRLNTIWRNKSLDCKIKIRLYDSLVLSALLYGAETWPMTVANMKRLEAAHHKWQRKILGVIWKDKISNEKIRERTGMEKLELIIRRRRLRWFGHVNRMEDNSIAKQAMKWSPADGKRIRHRL
jgi:hypothetical protein